MICSISLNVGRSTFIVLLQCYYADSSIMKGIPRHSGDSNVDLRFHLSLIVEFALLPAIIVAQHVEVPPHSSKPVEIQYTPL